MHAAFGEVDGWEMPRVYQNIKAEYLAGKGTVGVADRSHFGRLRVSGAKRLDLLHRLTTNHLKDLKAGQGAETVMCTNKGRIIDDLFVYADEDHYILVTSPGMGGTIKETIEKLRFRDDVTLEDVTATTAMLTIYGPEAARFLGWAAHAEIKGVDPNHWRSVAIEGTKAMAARVMGIGGGGFNLIMEAEDASALWRGLFKEGETYGVNPMGAEAYELLRVEFGVPAFGRELTEDFNPLETRLNDAIHWAKGCYTGQEVIARLDSRQKIQKLLTGFIVEVGEVPEPRSRVFIEGVEVGVITSVVPSLELRRIICLGYIRTAHDKAGTEVTIHSRGDEMKAEVAALPFATSGLPASTAPRQAPPS
jgi:folate-binding protein YgfZ